MNETTNCIEISLKRIELTREKDVRSILDRLIVARKAAGLSQGQVSKILGRANGITVSHIETGRDRLTMELFLELCQIYHCSEVWALTGVNPNFDPQPIIEILGEHYADLDKVLSLMTMMKSGD